jgi:hypothetical protein
MFEKKRWVSALGDPNRHKGRDMLDWIVANREWLFEGLGVTLLVGAGLLVKRFVTGKAKPKHSNQVQRSGSNSSNIQVGGDLSIGSQRDLRKGK